MTLTTLLTAVSADDKTLTTSDWISLICGIIGAICVAAYTIPGLITLFKTKNTDHVGIPMYSILMIGCLGSKQKIKLNTKMS